MKSMKDKADALADVAERVALSNEFRTDGFQDSVVRQVNDARERWRGENGELPRRGRDPVFDALIAMADAADSSPLAVRDACAEALRVSEKLRTAQ
jgi:hypothetical protein